MLKKVLVIGASGKVGSELVKLLINNHIPVRAASRKPDMILTKYQNLIEAIKFDYDDPQTFAPSLIGIDKIFLIVRPGDNHSDKAAKPIIDEAKKVRIKHIVSLTAMGVENEEDFMLRKVEKNIEDSGISFTHLRPNWFMQNFNSPPMLNEIKAFGSLSLPAADASVSFIDVRDIAVAGFTALTEKGCEGKSFTLTGKKALTYSQVVEKISTVSGKKITYVPLTEKEARDKLIKNGVQEGLIERWTEFYRKIRNGFCSPIYDDIEVLINQRPITFDQYTEDNALSWK